jgi:soluble lytic murein transglycosylase-like protein
MPIIGNIGLGTWQNPIPVRNLEGQAKLVMKNFCKTTSPLLRLAFALGVVLYALIVPIRARAGAVYRCDGPNGQIAFTNKPGTFTHCKKVSDYLEPAPVAKAAQAKGPQSDYRSEPGTTPVESAASTPAAAAPADPKFEVRRGAVYKIAKTNGITEYTNVKPGGGSYQVLFTYMASCFACNVHSTVNFGATPLRLDAFRDEIAAAAAETGVDPALLRAIIHAESAFNPNAVSVKGAQGLMQLMPGTASDLGVANPFNASQNIRGGAQYLGALLKQFNGNERLAAAAYDAGAQNVQKYNGVPPFDETQVYVQRVATLRQRYHEASVPPVATASSAPGVPSS